MNNHQRALAGRVCGLLALGVGVQPVLAAPFPPEFELSSLLAANGGNGSAGFALNGIVGNASGGLGDLSGTDVSGAGDINGDGIGDVIVSAPGALFGQSPNGSIGDAGQTYVVFGRAAGGFPAEFELSSLLAANGGNGSAGFALNGIDFTDDSGDEVSAAGDINGDGFDDLVIGADDPSEAYVIFGRGPESGGFPAELELSSLLPANGGNGSAGFVLFDGADAVIRLGFSVAAAGDVNGDGLADLLVGAPDAAPGGRAFAGQTFVVFGRSQAPGGSPVFPAQFDVTSLLAANGGNGSAGFVLNGIDADLGDPEDPGDGSGWSLDGAGDVNGDGVDDIVVGAFAANPHGRQDAGQAYVVFGRDRRSGQFPAEIELSSLLAANGGNGSAGFALNGIHAEDSAGEASMAGDVNGDGVEDVLVGALQADPGGRNLAGQSYVVFGRATGGFPAELELSSLLAANGGNGSTGFALNGIDAADTSGSEVSAAGDVNADGIDDILVSADLADPGGRQLAGESYIVFGRLQASGGFPAEIELSSLLAGNGGDGSTGFLLNGVAADDFSGGAVSFAGDVNGDNIDDVIIGALGADPGGRNQAGQSYVVFGRPNPPTCNGVLATIVGTDAANFLVGTARPDVIAGLAGNDVIFGLGSDDIICGGGGHDTIYGNTGDDTVAGERGSDALFGGFGEDQLNGGTGDDRLFGEAGRDGMLGGTGNDALFGGAGGDRLAGNEGNDRLFGETGNDTMDGGPHVDRCDGDGGTVDVAANCEQIVNVP
jgi:Ca2+-binding RTX toxin-like protein